MAVETISQATPEMPESAEISMEPADQDETKDWGAPRGAAAFAFLMLTGYAIYLALLWLEVIGRGS